MRFNLSLLRFLSFTLFLTFSGITVRAQSDRGSIAGTVLDSTGASVANAQVVAKGVDTSSEYAATTGPTGGYRMPEVKIGTYNVTVTAAGFKTEQKTAVQVQVNTVSTLDFALTIGAVNETVTIVADAPTIQSESSDIGTVVGRKQIEDLPLSLAATGQSHLRSVESF
ncbi:MAG: Cna B-type protein, partial [Candidatus Acidoferrum typicum]|nr:Cna B-type protein [Candidatus Acidoferrum typicum]